MAGVQRRWEEWRESAMVSWLKSNNVEIKVHRVTKVDSDATMHAAAINLDGVELTEFMLRFGDQI
jgi:hypothetical protein